MYLPRTNKTKQSMSPKMGNYMNGIKIYFHVIESQYHLGFKGINRIKEDVRGNKFNMVIKKQQTRG